MTAIPDSIRDPRRQAAFTLVELLVTISLILGLTALALASLSKMRASGDRVVATRNLAQVQLANLSYAGDHNGTFAPAYAFDDKGGGYVAWSNSPAFISYLKGESAVYLANSKTDVTVPLNMLDPRVVRAKQKQYTSVIAAFGYNIQNLPGGGWGQPGSTGTFRISQLTSPERTAAFFSATDAFPRYGGRFLWQGAGAVEGVTGDGKIAYRHNGKALVGYYDGHVGEVTMADMKKIDATGGANNIFWKGDAR